MASPEKVLEENYKREVTRHLGLYADQAYAVQTELFIIENPWYALTQRISSLHSEGRGNSSNIGLRNILIKDIKKEFLTEIQN